MCKLHTYYITNAKEKLPYYSTDIPENQLRAQMINSIIEMGDELEEITEADFNIFDRKNIVSMKMDTSRLYTLNITQEVELESQIFNMEQPYEDDQTTIQRIQPVVLNPQHDDYDVAELIRGINEL